MRKAIRWPCRMVFTQFWSRATRITGHRGSNVHKSTEGIFGRRLISSVSLRLNTDRSFEGLMWTRLPHRIWRQ